MKHHCRRAQEVHQADIRHRDPTIKVSFATNKTQLITLHEASTFELATLVRKCTLKLVDKPLSNEQCVGD